MIDEELTLRLGPQHAVIGRFGASLREYRLGDWDVIWGYRGRGHKKAGQGDVLMPFPSRLRDGRYAFGGRTHQIPPNDKEGPNAIHGFLRDVDWNVVEASDHSVRLATTIRPGSFAGYPFSLDVGVTYALSGDGLRTSFEARNTGSEPAPFGAGFHPYFTLGPEPIDAAETSFPAARYLEFENLVPTGRVLSVEDGPLDYRRPKLVGSNRFNFCFCDLARDRNGSAVATFARADGARKITLRFDRSFRYLVVYSGEAIPEPDRRRAFAIEPLTCATDAFNHPEWGLEILAPGATFRGSYEISPRA